MRTAVTISTPASAASGMLGHERAGEQHHATSSVSECTTAARRVRAPARTLTAVRAMAPVAGMPPNSGEATLARPWPNSSRSGSDGATSAMPSATLADSRLSMAARTATAKAAETSCGGLADRAGSDGVGSESGSAPMRATYQPVNRDHHGGRR